MKKCTSILSSPRNLVGDPLFRKRTTTAKTDSRLQHSGMTTITTRSRIKTLWDDGLTTGGRTANTCTAIAGFTLIELLVVVLIIGILAAVALPQYNVAVEKSRLGAMMPNIKTLKNAAELYYMANGAYIDDVSVMDISNISGCTDIGEGQLLCGNNGWYDWRISDDGNAEAAGGYTRPKGKFKTGIVMYGDHSQTPGVVECWAKSDDTVAKRVCKSMGGTESRTQTCPPSVGTCQIYRLP